MKFTYLIITITVILLCTLNPIESHAQTCADENSSHTIEMLMYFLTHSGYESAHIESGIQNLSINDITLLTSSEHSELCGQLMQTSLYLNAPSSLNDISFFKSSNRRFIVYFFLDTLPNYEELIFYSGPIGIIDILDENLEHVKSFSIR